MLEGRRRQSLDYGRQSSRMAVATGDGETPRMTCNTPQIDSYSTILLPEGCDLDYYRGVPHIYLNHQVWGSFWGDDNPQDKLAIGTADLETLMHTQREISFNIKFDTENDVESERDRVGMIASKVRDGFMTGVSIGFDFPRDGEYEKMALNTLIELTGLTMDDFGAEEHEVETIFLVARSWVLLEVSVVCIPANPGGLIREQRYMGPIGKAVAALIEGDLEESTKQFGIAKDCRDIFDNAALSAEVGTQGKGSAPNQAFAGRITVPEPEKGGENGDDRIREVVAEVLDERLRDLGIVDAEGVTQVMVFPQGLTADSQGMQYIDELADGIKHAAESKS